MKGSSLALAKSLYIKTYGCQMNVYDSARMADILAPLGYGLTEDPHSADMVILNTCHIREKATEKLFSELGRLRKARAGGAAPILAVAGCVAQAEGEEILRRAPEIDIVLGPQSYHRLPELMARALRSRAAKSGARRAGAGLMMTDFPVESKFDHLPEIAGDVGVSAFLAIQEGCDKFCTFCVVPYTRGAEFSRPVAEIATEAERLAMLGAREITLLGQNVNAYHGLGPDGAPWSLAQLLRYLARRLPERFRLRYTTSHPRDMTEDLIAAHGDLPQLMPYLHLPVQSGSDRILAAMNRGHDRATYAAQIAALRRARPDLALSSDFIVGFPGESEADFQATLDLVAEIGFAAAFSFKYSPRPGTPAAALPDQVPEAVKDERLQRLQAALNAQQRDFNRRTIGRRLEILIEKPGRHPGQWVGRSPYLQAVHVVAPVSPVGEILAVDIVALGAFSLEGRLPQAEERLSA